ncbi:HAAS signaling domain-containing protein [Cryobacterium sp. W22_MBD10_FK3]|uniref:HAAS signaling domain-containing protein n=1 Tax=Cryobacterium sp. W22_MBD10_FK3 TaxID=3240273 RepID=UPI003F8F7134
MNSPTLPTAPQVNRYLTQLSKELSSLPKQYREDVLDGIRVHINDALEQGGLDIVTVLEHVGTPQAVAGQALDDYYEESGRSERPAYSPLGRKLQVCSFALALLVVLLGAFVSLQQGLTVQVLLSSVPPLVLTLLPLLTRGRHWLLISAVSASTLTAFLVTSGVLTLALGSFSFPLTLFLIPTTTLVLVYIPTLALAVLPLFMRPDR